ncbi:ribosome hibernation-promoting factor, HPF/YfiA family [Trichlorobacter lovleyi]|uniref:Ribosome hibernation promoting factor n=1 Tax=Trichlorobacter lovleyi (strain ATCC BAA-1151 / DSM 17278 / SZ) TaxID=398767 RepID=B3E460_TRIL1|nr:ribosome-associated translation inhibitor RaiA [Trichlorobacter lovleyi]ACD95881.1 sigma 54 modulation protein/ribosomal protein S30EA [Trichlorobacter lovleyi SZ]
MQVSTTFRHMEQSEALKSYAEEKLERVAKYIDEPISAQVYFTVEKIRHIVEIVISGRGITTKASEATNDMYAAVDAVLDKIERQLKRYKEKLKDHKPAGENNGRTMSKKVFQAEGLETNAEPVVITTKTETAKPMAVEEAVMQMDLLHKDFLVFTDATSNEINVLYRRKDGNFGLIEPQRG